jgi:hypothetical protein
MAQTEIAEQRHSLPSYVHWNVQNVSVSSCQRSLDVLKRQRAKERGLNYPGAEARRCEKVFLNTRNAGELPTNIQLRLDSRQETMRVKLGSKERSEEKKKVSVRWGETRAVQRLLA